MDLKSRDFARGKSFIVGKWKVDFLVNFFSPDLAHIPAEEFKSDDGSDFSALEFEFFEDNSVTVQGFKDGRCERGVWQQTDLYEYEWLLDAFQDNLPNDFLKSAEKLSVINGNLAFAVSFLTVALKKTTND